MARAAAKRRPPVRHDTGRRKHKDSGGQRFEDTLFFNRIRKQTKWVFVLLIVAFGLGFVLFGVGNSNLSGLGNIFSGIRGGGGGPSVSKPLKETQKNPKDAAAWKSLANAYDVKQDYADAIPAWTTYMTLRPKDADALGRLGNDYQQRLSTQQTDLQNAEISAETSQTTNFGPPSTSPLGKALGSTNDPIAQAISTSASTQAHNVEVSLQQTATNLEGVYSKLTKLQPDDSGTALYYAESADQAGDTTAAIAAYQRFLKLAPDDPSAPQAKSRLKALQAELKGTSSSPAVSSSPSG